MGLPFRANERKGKELDMKVRILKVKGESKAARTIERMTKRGWTLKDQGARKQVFSLTTGFLTRKQIHTLTFTKGE